jgi:hypothetical protein
MPHAVSTERGLPDYAAAGAIEPLAGALLFRSVHDVCRLGRKPAVFLRPLFRVIPMTTTAVACYYGLSRLASISGSRNVGQSYGPRLLVPSSFRCGHKCLPSSESCSLELRAGLLEVLGD